MGREYPLPSRLRSPGERRKLPQWVLGLSPGEKRFHCFLSLSERLWLQRLLKINVVHSRPLVGKNGFAQCRGVHQRQEATPFLARAVLRKDNGLKA